MLSRCFIFILCMREGSTFSTNSRHQRLSLSSSSAITTSTSGSRSSSSSSSSSSRPTRLFGISEWRDNCFVSPEDGEDNDPSMAYPLMEPMYKPICLLPFDYTETLLQGETKELRLYEKRFLDLFQDVQNNYEGVVGMALISEADGGILGSVPVCEVVSSNNMGGDFGIFLTMQCVGRIELQGVLPDDGLGYLKASCVEILDGTCPDLTAATVVANRIDATVAELSEMEIDLAEQLERQEREGTLPENIKVTNPSDRFITGDEDNIDDGITRLERYRQAFHSAKEADTQGYVSLDEAVDKDGTSSSSVPSIRSLIDLTAISWAAFSTEAMTELDAAYRIQALDNEDLIDRLKQGLLLLEEKKLLVGKLLKNDKSGEEEGFQ